MENFADEIERLLIKKQETYGGLAAILEKERRAIVDMDVAAIWETSARKKEIGKTIGKIRSRILSLMDQQGIDHVMANTPFSLTKLMSLFSVANGQKARLMALKDIINTDKADVARLAAENQNHVKERLEIINNLVATLLPQPKPDSYGGKRSEMSPARANCFINKAV